MQHVRTLVVSMYTLFTGNSNDAISEILWVNFSFNACILGCMLCGSASCSVSSGTDRMEKKYLKVQQSDGIL